MANQAKGSPSDRRRTPRVNCRLHGRVSRGRERIRVRIVDISEGGLCLLSPLWLNPKQEAQIAIEVPGRATAAVRVEIWHIRREKSSSSTNKVWIAGAILRDSDSAYRQLLEAAGLAIVSPAGQQTPTATPAKCTTETPSTRRNSTADGPRTPKPTTPKPSVRLSTAASQADAAIDSVEPRVFRLRCKAKGSPRTRVLTLAADSEEDARKLASEDLGSAWDILEVLEA